MTLLPVPKIVILSGERSVSECPLSSDNYCIPFISGLGPSEQSSSSASNKGGGHHYKRNPTNFVPYITGERRRRPHWQTVMYRRTDRQTKRDCDKKSRRCVNLTDGVVSFEAEFTCIWNLRAKRGSMYIQWILEKRPHLLWKLALSAETGSFCRKRVFRAKIISFGSLIVSNEKHRLFLAAKAFGSFCICAEMIC